MCVISICFGVVQWKRKRPLKDMTNPVPTSSGKTFSIKRPRPSQHILTILMVLTLTPPLLKRALACTYAAAIELLKGPHWLTDFVGGKRSGPKSANHYVPIVRKLWRNVLP